MIQDNLQLFSFKFSNLPGCCGLNPCFKQGSKPADFWQIGRILLKKSGNSTSFLRLNASKFNKKATLPIIYALTAFATPIDERKEKITIKRGHQTFNNNKIRLILKLKQ